MNCTLVSFLFCKEKGNFEKPPWLTIAHPSSSEALMLLVTGTSFEYFHGSRAELSKRLHNGSCVGMIKDGSYQQKTSPRRSRLNQVPFDMHRAISEGLTPSDVGKTQPACDT
ncbi:hypothetical protein HID58_020419 [Brassica napus]|uniref:Uncharacterized protein n=1 Tax=Brassica napus TaxID=3708 RepID=A0ABQ7XJ00_BRANA|nr:hypothetical protein HID58_020419 [Brassica napus]